MAVLLPKATITHDCIDMEFKGHVSPVILPGLVKKTRNGEGISKLVTFSLMVSV